MKHYYCWRCECEMPFLEEHEWGKLPSTHDAMKEIKQYRLDHKCDLITARQFAEPYQMKVFEEITGMKYVHFDVIAHHRLSDWGPECKSCGHLLRSSHATICIECGQRTQTRGSWIKKIFRKLIGKFN